MEERFLEELYNRTINTLLIGFDEKEFPEIMSSYKNYLKNNYKNVVEEKDEIEKVVNLFADIENKRWSTKTKKQKQILIVYDEALERLKSLSGKAEKFAKKRLKHELSNTTFVIEITESQAEQYIQELEVYAKNVRQFNLDIAQTYLSEGILDFLYASKLSDNKSLRISRI